MELKDWFAKSKVVIFVNFHSLNTALARNFRVLMRKLGAKYFVAKKTLIKKTLNGFKFEGQMPELEGEVAMIFSTEDAVAPLKSLTKFVKANHVMKILGGIFDNSFTDKSGVLRLADLPSKEILIAQFINVINAPRRGLVVTLNGVMRNFVNVLRQIKHE